ncbi:MAG: Rieske (2Fe-2S) protein [Egibacteraceae bacterium]
MGYRPVLRSEDLPLGEGSGGGGGTRLRDQALETTVSRPVFHTTEVAEQEVLLTRLASGEVVAFQATCPHQAISLTRASVFDGAVRCPQHYYLYDPKTGRNILPTEDASPAALARLQPGHLTTYPVREGDGWIHVGDAPNPPPPDRPAPSAGATPAPAPAPACNPADGRPIEHPVEEVSATAGGDITLDLLTVVRPGHLWHIAVRGSAVALRGQVFQAPRTCQVRLSALGAGHATVRCAYGLPWCDQPREVRTFSVRVATYSRT